MKLHTFGQFIFHILGDFLGASAQGLFVVCLCFVNKIVRIHPGNVPDRGVCLDRQEFRVVFHVEDSPCGIVYPPYNDDADDDGISENIVDFLDSVVECDAFQRNRLFVRVDDRCFFIVRSLYICRVIVGGKRVYKVETFFQDGSVIISK